MQKVHAAILVCSSCAAALLHVHWVRPKCCVGAFLLLQVTELTLSTVLTNSVLFMLLLLYIVEYV